MTQKCEAVRFSTAASHESGIGWSDLSGEEMALRRADPASGRRASAQCGVSPLQRAHRSIWLARREQADPAIVASTEESNAGGMSGVTQPSRLVAGIPFKDMFLGGLHAFGHASRVCQIARRYPHDSRKQSLPFGEFPGREEVNPTRQARGTPI
jgi:hypothetical protein